MKTGRKSDRFDMIAGIGRVSSFVIVSGNRRMLAGVQTRDRIREGRPEIRIGSTAVACPPTGVHGELLEIRESPGLRDERDLTGRQIIEMAKIDLLRPFGF